MVEANVFEKIVKEYLELQGFFTMENVDYGNKAVKKYYFIWGLKDDTLWKRQVKAGKDRDIEVLSLQDVCDFIQDHLDKLPRNKYWSEGRNKHIMLLKMWIRFRGK